jgi:hypothetical protein
MFGQVNQLGYKDTNVQFWRVEKLCDQQAHSLSLSFVQSQIGTLTIVHGDRISGIRHWACHALLEFMNLLYISYLLSVKTKLAFTCHDLNLFLFLGPLYCVLGHSCQRFGGTRFLHLQCQSRMYEYWQIHAFHPSNPKLLEARVLSKPKGTVVCMHVCTRAHKHSSYSF